MPRPSLVDVRRPQILDAYARSLIKHGREGASLDRIAAEAGVTRALVRHYLGNREDVDRALAGYLRERFVEWFLGLGAGLPPRERLPIILSAMFEPRASVEPTAGVLDALLGASAEDPILRAQLRELYGELEHLLDAELAGFRPMADPVRRREVAYGILCLAGMNESLVELGLPADRSEAARRCAELLVASLY